MPCINPLTLIGRFDHACHLCTAPELQSDVSIFVLSPVRCIFLITGSIPLLVAETDVYALLIRVINTGVEHHLIVRDDLKGKMEFYSKERNASGKFKDRTEAGKKTPDCSASGCE